MLSAVVVSVVIPVYGAAELLQELVSRTQASVESIAAAHEIILVDDCGPGPVWPTIQAHSCRDGRIKGVRLARNFGQHAAIQAGLSQARGQWVVVMDCDLQDRPEDILLLWQQAQSAGLDKVLAVRRRQGEWLARVGSVVFYQLLQGLTGHRHNAGIANFGIYNRWVIDAVMAQRLDRPFFPVQAGMAGGTTGYVAVAHPQRPAGRSSYRLKGRVQLAVQVLRSLVQASFFNGQYPPSYQIAEITPSCPNV